MADQALWYVAHTFSGHENKVAQDLRTMVENRHLQDLICDVRVPVEITTEDVLDKNGNNLAAQVEFETFNRQLNAVNRHTGSKLVNAVQQDVHAILQLGEAQIEKSARALIDAARNEADEKLSAELSRLEALRAVNPNIRDDELTAIESNRQQVMESLDQAGWRLDALRLIVVTHQ